MNSFVRGTLITMCLVPWVLRAQSVHEAGPGGDVLRDEFTSITAVRELSDSRVLVADAREKRVVVGDWRDGSTRQLGRVGDGPFEYQAPSRLLPTGGDSTYIVDSQARRWILLVGDVFGRSLEPERARRLTRFSPPIRGMNEKGQILVTVPAIARERTFDSDSVVLALADATSDRLDTVARLRGRGSGRGSVVRNDGGRATHFALYNPFGVEEQGLMFADGWIAVAWLDPFRVDWRTPEGEWLRNAAFEVSRSRVTEREKQAAVAREWAWLPKPLPSPTDFRGWPEFVPAFPNDALLGLPDGRVAIARMPTVAEPNSSCDIVDRRGKVVGRIVLQPKQRIVAFGAEHFYVVSKDEMDVERLSRHVMPAM